MVDALDDFEDVFLFWGGQVVSFGSTEEDNSVVRRAPVAGDFVHFRQLDAGKKGLVEFQFFGDAGDGFLLEEVARVFGGIGAGVGFVSLGIGGFH